LRRTGSLRVSQRTLGARRDMAEAVDAVCRAAKAREIKVEF
jgi:hypothetical protein